MAVYTPNALVKLATRQHMFADAGQYFVGTNPTPGTAFASAVNASFDVTKGLFTLYNGGGDGGRHIYLDYLKVLPTVAPASATSFQFAMYIDNKDRYTSGGTQVTPRNPNMDNDETSSAVLFASSGGTVITVAAAGTAARLVSRGVARSVIPAVLEEILIQFGVDSSSGSSSGTAAGRSAVTVPPVILGPGDSWVLIHWFPSNAITGLSYEFEMGWFEL